MLFRSTNHQHTSHPISDTSLPAFHPSVPVSPKTGPPFTHHPQFAGKRPSLPQRELKEKKTLVPDRPPRPFSVLLVPEKAPRCLSLSGHFRPASAQRPCHFLQNLIRPIPPSRAGRMRIASLSGRREGDEGIGPRSRSELYVCVCVCVCMDGTAHRIAAPFCACKRAMAAKECAVQIS